MKTIKATGKVKEFLCDFCDNKAVFTEEVMGGSDTMYLCKVHKNKETMIVRSGLVNTENTFMLLHLVRGRGNIKQAIVETESDIRQAIAMKDSHQEKITKFKLEALKSLI